MKRTEETELTTLCMLRDGDRYLMQDRVKPDWRGLTFPGGHVEKGESFVDAAVREMREESGLTVLDPRLCGVKQFPRKDGGRYIVFLFSATRYEGELRSSDEGRMVWMTRDELAGADTVSDLFELLDVMESDDLNEFQYVIDEKGDWNVVKK